MAKETDDAPKYGVPELAEELGVEAATVRVSLRALEKKKVVTKAGKRWGWDTKKEFDAVLKSLRARETAPSGEKPAKGSPEAKEKMAKLRAARQSKDSEPAEKPKKPRKKKVTEDA